MTTSCRSSRDCEGRKMSGMDSLVGLVGDLAAAAPLTLVNPYACFEPELDRPGCAATRAATLLAYLEARSHPALLLVGEAAGYQGCRFSGIAFTSERALPTSQWTSMKPEGWREPSATIVHDALKELGLEDRTILWNVVPFHPAGPVPLSNRTPRAAERRAGREWLRRILAITQPDVVAAIGRVAERALRPGTLYLRHPARGGAVRFHHGLAELARERGLV
jgi:uracil-DNA glycosylase